MAYRDCQNGRHRQVLGCSPLHAMGLSRVQHVAPQHDLRLVNQLPCGPRATERPIQRRPRNLLGDETVQQAATCPSTELPRYSAPTGAPTVAARHARPHASLVHERRASPAGTAAEHSRTQTDGRCASDALQFGLLRLTCGPLRGGRTRAPSAERIQNARKVLMMQRQLAQPDTVVARGFRRRTAAALQRLGSAGCCPALSAALGACDSIALHVVRCAWHS